MKHNWAEIERQWAANNRDEVSKLISVCQSAHQLIADLATSESFTNREPSARLVAQRLLIRRLGEELRALELLAVNGHGFQAISAAANLFEQSHFLTYLDVSEDTAERWRTWSDPHKPMEFVKQLVEKSGELRGWDESRINDEYESYRLLCAFKHNNSMTHRILQMRDSDPDVYLAQLSVGMAVGFALDSVALLAILHDEDLDPEWLNTLNGVRVSADKMLPRIME